MKSFKQMSRSEILESVDKSAAVVGGTSLERAKALSSVILKSSPIVKRIQLGGIGHENEVRICIKGNVTGVPDLILVAGITEYEELKRKAKAYDRIVSNNSKAGKISSSRMTPEARTARAKKAVAARIEKYNQARNPK